LQNDYQETWSEIIPVQRGAAGFTAGKARPVHLIIKRVHGYLCRDVQEGTQHGAPPCLQGPADAAVPGEGGGRGL